MLLAHCTNEFISQLYPNLCLSTLNYFFNTTNISKIAPILPHTIYYHSSDIHHFYSFYIYVYVYSTFFSIYHYLAHVIVIWNVSKQIPNQLEQIKSLEPPKKHISVLNPN